KLATTCEQVASALTKIGIKLLRGLSRDLDATAAGNYWVSGFSLRFLFRFLCDFSVLRFLCPR
ncbi:MAG: hypothetical protein KDD69_15845, partial [Bdellovibrionales bacterium]|nr:hypothetical protein [Bdellovibrionales bacterium]